MCSRCALHRKPKIEFNRYFLFVLSQIKNNEIQSLPETLFPARNAYVRHEFHAYLNVQLNTAHLSIYILITDFEEYRLA